MTSPEPDRRSTAFDAASVPENYERRLAPVIFEPWAEILVEAVGVRPGDRVLDVASGTGVAARAAARRAGPDGRVVASDVSGAMLSHAATRDVPPGAAPIEYLEAPATDLKVADGAFDVVLCQQGLPFFTDRRGAAAEIRAGILGTPFGPLVDALPADRRAELARRFAAPPGEPVRRTTTAVLARATA